MKYRYLIKAGLWRNPARTLFTVLSVFVSFVLLGALQGVNRGFEVVASQQRSDRLWTESRHLDNSPLPLSALERIKQIDGVRDVAARSLFLGYYREPNQGVVALATQPESWLAVRPEFTVAAAALEKMKQTRTGMLVTPAALARYGWKLGDRVPVQSSLARLDGASAWMFDIVGILRDTRSVSPVVVILINHAYFDDERASSRTLVDRRPSSSS